MDEEEILRASMGLPRTPIRGRSSSLGRPSTYTEEIEIQEDQQQKIEDQQTNLDKPTGELIMDNATKIQRLRDQTIASISRTTPEGRGKIQFNSKDRLAVLENTDAIISIYNQLITHLYLQENKISNLHDQLIIHLNNKNTSEYETHSTQHTRTQNAFKRGTRPKTTHSQHTQHQNTHTNTYTKTNTQSSTRNTAHNYTDLATKTPNTYTNTPNTYTNTPNTYTNTPNTYTYNNTNDTGIKTHDTAETTTDTPQTKTYATITKTANEKPKEQPWTTPKTKRRYDTMIKLKQGDIGKLMDELRHTIKPKDLENMTIQRTKDDNTIIITTEDKVKQRI
ncbi:unnamed protein product [Diabrotica balteata]|uniref:Uncharacterized protein n=1 Tax=Diabrotica balteata TaxID=107213 RepID=A0A9N9TDK0_DIABA|nr:unnamed protein product [Diabrotica balteata]